MAPDREQRADARASIERILAAAPEVLARDPYASLQRVAEASGVHRATVYRHFASRERLISHLYEGWLADVSNVFTTIDVAAEDALAELRRVTREAEVTVRVWRGTRQEPQLASGIAFFDHMLEMIAWHAALNLEVEFARKTFALRHVVTPGSCSISVASSSTGWNATSARLPVGEVRYSMRE